MNKIYILIAFITLAFVGAGCNSEWEEEQYDQFISFRSPLDSKGVTNVYVPYTRKGFESGMSNYQLPVIVSGSVHNDKNLTVHVALDPDTLNTLNLARYATRTDLFYKNLNGEQTYATYPETAEIKSGEDVGLLDLSFNFKGIDMSDKWVLPMQILDDPSYGYTSHPRKNYAKAILRIFPFNDFSGDYAGTLLTNKVVMGTDTSGKPIETTESITRSLVRGYVIDESSIFTYAGIVDEDYTDRKRYKIKFKFNGDTNGPVTISCDNATDIDFKLTEGITPSFRISSTIDEKRPYLENRYVIINNIDYYFNYIPAPGTKIRYHVKGTITLSRKINTQIPDEDQAIEW